MNLKKIFGAKKCGTTYLEALNATQRLLESQNETHWRNWILRDIDEWKNNLSVAHHLSAYGGMGSFNDVGFENPWIGHLFDELKSACYFLARHPSHKAEARFIIPSAESIQIPLTANVDFKLHGWRCLACGYSVVSDRDIDCFIAPKIIREEIIKAIDSGRLEQFVESVIQQRPSHKVFTPDAVAVWAQRSGIQLRHKNDWLRPCPKCNDNDTAVCYWNLIEKGDFRFEPDTDNLPLRKKS